MPKFEAKNGDFAKIGGGGGLKAQAKELLRFHSGHHGNLVTIAKRHVADAYCPKEPPYQIWTQYDLRQRSCEVKCIFLLF